ncbi:MAG TPA: phosphatidylglycerophosphatase A [Oligoflexia bacterium]|nr:phosphatidylglycerophosphatase A [Oligoflexia bacterium]HMR24489.1 phosphatidylglycerophosphatase A [Oligoflexia bacterium]
MLKQSFNFHFYQKGLPVKQRVLAMFLTLLGSGLSAKAPGTIGSLFALGLWYLSGLHTVSLVLQVFSALFMLAIGYLACLIYEKQSQEKNKDNQCIVIDEAAGMWIALIAMPEKWWVYILVFVLFRVFDIVKLFPCDYFDRNMKNAAGIMLDDVVAGIYANTSAYILISFLKWM